MCDSHRHAAMSTSSSVGPSPSLLNICQFVIALIDVCISDLITQWILGSSQEAQQLVCYFMTIVRLWSCFMLLLFDISPFKFFVSIVRCVLQFLPATVSSIESLEPDNQIDSLCMDTRQNEACFLAVPFCQSICHTSRTLLTTL